MLWLYRPFFLFYGALHIAGGTVLWVAPEWTRFLLTEPLSAAAGVLVGFGSMLGGLGFGAAAFATGRSAQRAVVAAAIAADVVNFAAHATNVMRGDSPGFMLGLAALGTGTFLVVLLLLARALVYSGGSFNASRD